MEQLLKKANIKDSQIKSLITRIVAKNLSSLSEPCYYPELKKHYYEFLKLTGLTEDDIKQFTKRRWTGRKEIKFLTHNQPAANFYIFLMQYFLSKRDKIAYQHFMIFFIIRYYANLMHKSFKYCNDDTFKYALDILTKTHLFIREKTIPSALYYVANEMVRRWTRGLRTNDLDSISRFMQDSRTRVSQSMKSFASTYYKAAEEGKGLKTAQEPTDDEENEYQYKSTEKSAKLVDEITRKITVYRFTDHKIQEEARNLSKISSSLATQIVSKLNNTKHSDNIRIILKLFIKNLKDSSSLCGKKYEGYVRQLMSIKRTKMKIYFKQQVNILLLNLLDEIDYKKKYSKVTSQTQFLINLFLAYYLTMILRRTVC